MAMGHKVLGIFETLIVGMKEQIEEYATITFVMTLLSTNYANNGPNVLGLNEELTQPSVVLQVECLLPTPDDEVFLTERFEAVIIEIADYAASTQQSKWFKYINYVYQTA